MFFGLFGIADRNPRITLLLNAVCVFNLKLKSISIDNFSLTLQIYDTKNTHQSDGVNISYESVCFDFLLLSNWKKTTLHCMQMQYVWNERDPTPNNGTNPKHWKINIQTNTKKSSDERWWWYCVHNKVVEYDGKCSGRASDCSCGGTKEKLSLMLLLLLLQIEPFLFKNNRNREDHKAGGANPERWSRKFIETVRSPFCKTNCGWWCITNTFREHLRQSPESFSNCFINKFLIIELIHALYIFVW